MDDAAALALAAALREAMADLSHALKSPEALPAGQVAVLGLLERGPATTADLAAQRRVRHQSVAAVVRELSACGLVTTCAHPGDGRKVLLSLSPSGAHALEHDRATRTGLLARAVAGALDEAEAEVLRTGTALMRRVAAALSDPR